MVAPHHAAVSQHMAFDFFQQLRAGQAGGQGVRGEVQGVDLDDVVVRAVTDRRARADVTRGFLAVGAAEAFQGGFGADTGGYLVRGGLDAVMHPVIDALAFLAVRVVHDDGVALRGGRSGVPVQGWRNVVTAAAGSIAGGGRGEQAIVRYARYIQGEAFLGLCRKLHAKGHCQSRQPRIQ